MLRDNEIISVRVTELINTRCDICDRVWDLTDTDDANDYYYGHDCEEM